jgi:predicted RNA binding protein YcfA (HicA-like mRNA interferase family)
MGRCEKLEALARRSPVSLKFRELRYLVECNGFHLDRIKGSHHVYVHFIGERANLQATPDGGAKSYQVRQVLESLDRIRERE